MADNEFSQAPTENEKERLQGWRDNIQESVFGPEGDGGTLNGDNIQNINDPGDTADVSDTAVKLNLLFAELRILGIM
jgi:hypothetical protein